MMKKMSLCTLLLFVCGFVVGQCSFAVIDDADGYTNLRNSEKEIVAKVYENDILFIYDSVDEQYKDVLAFWNMPDKFWVARGKLHLWKWGRWFGWILCFVGNKR